jgi:hypothetical protein
LRSTPGDKSPIAFAAAFSKTAAPNANRRSPCRRMDVSQASGAVRPAFVDRVAALCGREPRPTKRERKSAKKGNCAGVT